jgi:hypothetical protein
MIYIIFTKARFSTANKRNQTANQVTNYLAQPGISNDFFVPAQVTSYDAAYKGWANALSVMVRFRTQANRDNLWTQLDAFLSNSNQAPLESYGEKWDQMLDAPDPDLDTTRYNQFSKTWV